jgi:hypothetical protein
MAQKKYPSFNTPKGAAVWPNLNAPDTKFKPEGEYTCKLAFDPNLPEVQKMIEHFEKVRDELFKHEIANADTPAKKKALEKYTVAPVFTEELDKEGDETGRILINFKMKASGTTKQGKAWTRKPGIFDSKGVEIKSPPTIGGGSILRVNCEFNAGPVPSAKTFYLSPKLVGVKLLELVTFGAKTAKDMGFDEDESEGGYVADNLAPATFGGEDDADETADEGGNGGSGDF